MVVHLGEFRLPGGRIDKGQVVIALCIVKVVQNFKSSVVFVDVPLKFLLVKSGGAGHKGEASLQKCYLCW